MFSVELVICLSVTNITQKVQNGLQRNFMEGVWGGKETPDYILVAILVSSDE